MLKKLGVPFTRKTYSKLKNLLVLFLAILIFQPISPIYAALDYGKQTLIGADFSNNDLKGATFYLTNLQNANFSGSDLKGASFFDANLQGANLSNTNLRDVTMDAAILEGTNLSNAVLEGAFAFNTKFKDVNIRGADFTDVLMSKESKKSLCDLAEGVNPETKRETYLSLDCN
tara:strand:+ start:172 stop:690 length:519 start_codon:yes stop_codon:yes gene_type:complete